MADRATNLGTHHVDPLRHSQLRHGEKARVWLDGRGVAYTFHDYKKLGIDDASLRRWIASLGWETVLNRAGTTFRALPDADKADLDDNKAIALMLAQPSMIKRPIVEGDGALVAGFKPDAWQTAGIG